MKNTKQKQRDQLIFQLLKNMNPFRLNTKLTKEQIIKKINEANIFEQSSNLNKSPSLISKIVNVFTIDDGLQQNDKKSQKRVTFLLDKEKSSKSISNRQKRKQDSIIQRSNIVNKQGRSNKQTKTNKQVKVAKDIKLKLEHRTLKKNLENLQQNVNQLVSKNQSRPSSSLKQRVKKYRYQDKPSNDSQNLQTSGYLGLAQQKGRALSQSLVSLRSRRYQSTQNLVSVNLTKSGVRNMEDSLTRSKISTEQRLSYGRSMSQSTPQLTKIGLVDKSVSTVYTDRSGQSDQNPQVRQYRYGSRQTHELDMQIFKSKLLSRLQNESRLILRRQKQSILLRKK